MNFINIPTKIKLERMKDMRKKNQSMITDIKEQVLAELGQDKVFSENTYNKGYQAYLQLVDAVREEVLFELRNQKSPLRHQLSQADIQRIKQEIICDLQKEPE